MSVTESPMPPAQSTVPIGSRTRREQIDTLAVQARQLWPAGVALVIALGVATVVPGAVSRRVWLAFFALGTALPAAVALALAIDPRKVSHDLARVVRWLALFASVIALGAGIVHSAYFPLEAIAALIQVLAVVVLTKGTRGSETPVASVTFGSFALWAAVSLAAWGVAGSLLWWHLPGGLWHPWVLAVFAASALTVFGALWMPDAIANRVVAWAGSAIAITLLAVASVRTNDLFDVHSMYTWEPFIGPVDLVRQGGWMLWDVPSQYGYLNELVVAWVPTRSPWEGLFVVNSVMCFLLATAVFVLVRSLGRGILNLGMSFIVALVACFLRPGLGPQIIGPGGYPSTGAFRFMWCMALLLILVTLLRVHSSGTRIAILIAGNLAWIMGVLWSAESAIYSSFVWLPGYFLMVVAEGWSQPDVRKRILRIGGLTAVPLLFLAVTLVIVFGIYQLGLGHGPDPRAFVDFGLAFQSGVVAYPIDPGGPGWVLFIVYVAALIALVWRVRKQSVPASVVLVATAALIFSTSSYFVGRSHPNNVWNLAPEICIALAVMLGIVGRNMRADPLPALMRLVAAPLLIIFLFGALANRAMFLDWVTRPQHDILHIESSLLDPNPSLQALLVAHVNPGDRVAYIGDSIDPVLAPNLYSGTEQPNGAPLWLPLVPFTAINQLPPARRAIYMERFIAEHPEGGWLIERTGSQPQTEWVLQIIQAHFTPAQTYSNTDFRLTLWQPKAGSP